MFVHEEKKRNNNLNESCNHCGRSVKFGSGLFINRIPDLNDIITRMNNNRKYPLGDFVCVECDEDYEENN